MQRAVAAPAHALLHLLSVLAVAARGLAACEFQFIMDPRQHWMCLAARVAVKQNGNMATTLGSAQ
jgi:hypothetical protein